MRFRDLRPLDAGHGLASALARGRPERSESRDDDFPAKTAGSERLSESSRLSSLIQKMSRLALSRFRIPSLQNQKYSPKPISCFIFDVWLLESGP